jgi:hypothetical protein
MRPTTPRKPSRNVVERTRIMNDDRRSNGRTRIAKAASLFFMGQTGERSRGVDLTDVTDGGAGIHTQGLAALPLTFELAFDNLRRKCRLVWRKGNFFGVAFEDHNKASHSETYLEADVGSAGPAVLALNDAPQLTYFDNADGWSECTSKVLDQRNERQDNLRFTVGVTIALTLPIFIGMGFYIATTAILRLG